MTFFFSFCKIYVPAVARLSSQLPIDEEWKKAAAKELHGKDVEKTLMWKTAEVECFIYVYVCLVCVCVCV